MNAGRVCRRLVLIAVIAAGCSNGTPAGPDEERISQSGPKAPIENHEDGSNRLKDENNRLDVNAVPESGEHAKKSGERALDNPHIPEKKEQSPPREGLFKTTLETESIDGDKISLRFTLENISGVAQQIVFNSGQRYDIDIFDRNNEEVYKWSRGSSFIMAITEETLEKGDKLTFSEEWDLKDNNGNSVGPGVYTIKVSITAKLKNGKASADELSDQSIVEISAE
ncbi:BsuPI-related putative proteinase inhibitor [Paenibacillus alkalitolerans]|uniref:BsuPI-related putative proteinase inhibitor n=1 Tax=Paenibacillus alkalitolerans TaxID=2799335 RepID=UPI0018F29734|nr:BsuPI-related putative proteinase inhibitor [Paenibacillus alkalitolerans]